jgi:hypothetical protein
MPLPAPKKDEQKGDFISRCMGSKTMNKEFPDNKQRAAVCNKQWTDKKTKKAIITTAFSFRI